MKYLIEEVGEESRLGFFESKLKTFSIDEKKLEQKEADPVVEVQKKENGFLVQRQSGKRTLYPASVRVKDSSVFIATALGCFRLAPKRGLGAGSGDSAAGSKKILKASMPGKILKVLCRPGDQVEKGQALLIIEAMKMENEIKCVLSSEVKTIAVKEGDRVETGTLLMEFS